MPFQVLDVNFICSLTRLRLNSQGLNPRYFFQVRDRALISTWTSNEYLVR
jgi:hypothetical protein